ncbi:hypothetical protein [Caviibacter abscessus]|uniref:hypothetical protein n=1 Tax=Caviibacter abscessus TaxID=1766719 RepID=UPI00082F4BFD|nr:hypothetical protein [Caviibacter abscessus]
MKKVLLYIFTLILFISCDAQTARKQFEAGQYLKSVQTTVKYVSNGKFSKLKLKDQDELISRIKVIDKYYRDNIEDQEEGADIKTLYESFHIYGLIKKVPELQSELRYLTQSVVDNNIELVVAKQNKELRTLGSRSSSEIERILKGYNEIKEHMQDYKIVGTKYEDHYKAFSRNLADGYLILSRKFDLDESQYLQALKNASQAYSYYDKDYKGSKTQYEKVKKELDLKKADAYFDEGRRNLFFGNYDIALDKLNEAYNIYNKYSSNKRYEVRDYINKVKDEKKKRNAEEHYGKALKYLVQNDYKNAVKEFYATSNIIYNYRDSYTLAKKYEKYIGSNTPDNNDAPKIIDKTFSLNLNGDVSRELIISELERLGFRYTNHKPFYVIEVETFADYDISTQVKREPLYVNNYGVPSYYEKITETVTEVVKYDLKLSTKSYERSKKLEFKNQYTKVSFTGNIPATESGEKFEGRQLGKAAMIEENSYKVERELRELIQDFARTVR